MDAVMSRAQGAGKVRTLLGRLCRFHLWEPNQFGIHKPLPHDAALAEHGPGIRRAYTYKALNRLIQGSHGRCPHGHKTRSPPFESCQSDLSNGANFTS